MQGRGDQVKGQTDNEEKMSEDSKTNDAGEGGPRGGLTTWIVGWEAPQPEAFKMQCSNLWKMVAGMLHWVDMTVSHMGLGFSCLPNDM
mmetsp:Transcript_3755/g.10213  ORF Transcript_3755/g.10213 Transcript_3755/m.10213 type:complete len:88 (+) Transcript_3755:2960-3223(+)